VFRKFPHARRIVIDHYKAVFNRSNQHFQQQKASMKLILAVKRDHFLYAGSPAAPDFGHPNFFYNALMLNCLYNCDYCYLQGMYPSGNTVMFVNSEDYLAATAQKLKNGEEMYLCISYDTDLLAFEHIIPYAHRWIQFARQHPNLLIELRTKSANFNAIKTLKPVTNVILAWTLSPASITKIYEKKTPSLKARLNAIKKAMTTGWTVRLCFDPLLHVPDWQEIYTEFVEQVFTALNPEKIQDVSIGVFRMNSGYLHRIRKMREDSPVLYHPVDVVENVATYPQTVKAEMEDWVYRQVRKYLPDDRVFAL